MSFWQDFGIAIHNAIQAAWSEILKIAVAVKPMAVATAEDVAQIALGAVLQQAPLVISGTEKLAAATANVINTLATQGKAVAATQAQAAVQAAYNEMSARLAAARPVVGEGATPAA